MSLISEIEKIIKPENELEVRIINDLEFQEGCDYGKPRPGHPEGKILYHIKEVLDNVDKYTMDLTSEVRLDLRLLSLIHDTFKYKVDNKLSKSGENHHAMIARRFAEKYNLPLYLLDIIELHDEAYNSYSKGSRDGNWLKAEERGIKLIKRLGDKLSLYLLFFQCDNETGNKEQTSVNWFKSLCDNLLKES